MLGFWLCFVLVSSSVGVSQEKNDYTEFGRLYHRRGNVSFVGVFEDRFGDDCSTQVGRGLEEVASVIWTLEALNKYEYLPGMSIGATLFGVCENLTNENVFLKTLTEHENDDYIGILTTSSIRQKLPQLEHFFNGNLHTVDHVINIDVITDATVQLLINLQWINVSQVISDSANTLKSFREKASEEGVFVQDELLISDRNSTKNLKGSVSVVVAAFTNISKLIEKLHNTILILTPTDFVFDVSLLDINNSLVSIPPIGEKGLLSGFIKTAQNRKEFFGPKPPAKGPLFIGAARSVLKLLKPIKTAVEDFCQDKHSHSERGCAPILSNIPLNTSLPLEKSMKISPDDVEETLKVLNIEPTSNDEMFLFITSIINGNASEDVAIFQIFPLKRKTFHPILIMINDDPVKKEKSVGKIDYFEENFKFDDPPNGDPVSNLMQKFVGHSGEVENYNFTGKPPFKICEDGQTDKCSNHTLETTELSWRSVTWVSINTSLGFVGVTCTLSTMLFVVIRLCKDDILEGSPCFTLLLMVSVVFMYFSSFPFHFDFSNSFICTYRTNGPPTVFAVLFSLLLSRSLLLAFSESVGFVTHINGYLQSILCFFMIGVQVSIISQNWIFSTVDSKCSDINDKYKIIFSLGYDFLLLILLACVSPFIIRSKQNYKEGLLFSISAFFITVVWSAWISFYVLLPNEYKDAAVAIGLNSTATVLLFCIFIPQTYFMAAPYPPSRTLSPLNGNILRDVNFKSTQALNESAFGTYRNSEMGVSNPNFLTTRTNDSNNPITRETVIDVSPDTSQPN